MYDDISQMKVDMAELRQNHEVRISHLEDSIDEIKDAMNRLATSVEGAVNDWKKAVSPLHSYIEKSKTQKAFIISGLSFVAGAVGFIWLVLQIIGWVFARTKGL